MTNDDELRELGAELFVLDEIWNEPVTGVDAFYCPRCAEIQFSLGWEGSIHGFEMACKGCDASLFYYNTVCTGSGYYQKHGSPEPDELRECVTRYWDRSLAEGVYVEAQELVDNGRRHPRFETVEHDLTDHLEKRYKHDADHWGWDWEPDTDTEIEERGSGE